MNSQTEEMHWSGSGRRLKSVTSAGHHPVGTSMYMFIYLQAVRILPFQVFVEGFSCMHDELYHWPGVVSPAFSPFPSLEVAGLGPKDQTLIMPWSF